MNYKKLIELVLKVLKTDDRLWNEDKIELNQTLLLDLLEKIDENVIGLLHQEKDLREKFFVKIKDVYVFKTNDFRFFLEENKVDNSYTAYKNRIGLTDGKKFLKDTNDVVLDFPYKDCILEGGQSTEEGTDTYIEYDEKAEQYEKKQDKRKEIFFNSVLAHDEIDRLFDPKALTNWKRFTKDGEQEVKEIKRDEDGTIKENLIIKGNNLLALHSLKKQFAGKVKLIYIDPPYYFKDTKADDSFAYNSNFKLSTWLTFMKNRLDITKKLLADEGTIFVQIKDDGMAHLKLLMDDVFGIDNFVNCIAVKMSEASGVKMTHAKTRFPNIKEYIFFYKKSNNFKGFNRIDKYKNKEWDTENNIFLEKFTQEDRNKLISIEEKKDINEKDIENAIKILSNAKKVSLSEKIKSLSKEIDINEWLLENSYRIIKTAGSSSLAKQVKKLKNIPNQDISAFISSDCILFYYITDFNRNTKQPRLQVIFADENIWKNPCDFWQDIKTTGAIANERGVQLSGGKKPEKLLHRIIDMTTEEGDIILDYHSGSGTTAGVAHKMKRQWITIEQIDNQIDLSITGLKNVVNGDGTGISELVNWQGGGDFIYFELAKWNETAKEEILAFESLNELITFFDEMYERYFLNYNLKIKEFREKVIKEEEFKNLTLEEQKKMFVAMLDNNQMYVNKTEMADKKFGIDKEDQNLTLQFYNSEE